jgi:hypothetical protein
MNGTIMPQLGSIGYQFYPNTLMGGSINIINALTHNLAGIFSGFFIIIFATNFIFKERIFSWSAIYSWRLFILLIGLTSLLIRGGGGPYALPYYYAILCLPIYLIHHKNGEIPNFLIISIIIGCLIKLSLFMPSDSIQLLKNKIPEYSEFSDIVKKVTNKNDKIIAYSFRSYEYILSNRLPASANFTYSPWQNLYNQSPKFNIKMDACEEINKIKPKIMLIDKLNFWGEFPWLTYGSCIDNILIRYYYKIPDRPYYVRKDIASNFKNTISSELEKNTF